MHIASTVNPLTKSSSDVPVLVLALSNSDSVIKSRKFVARPTHYADLISTARRAFKLAPGAKPIFFTKTLDVCRGHLVEIDESAYMTISTYLDEVTMTLTADPVEEVSAASVGDGDRIAEARDDSSARALTTKRLGKTRQVDTAEGSAEGERPQERAGLIEKEDKDLQSLDRVEIERRDALTVPREKASARSKPIPEAKPAKHEEPAPPAQMPPPPVPKARQRKPEPQPEPRREPEAHELFEEEPSFSQEAGYEDYEEARHKDPEEAAASKAGGSNQLDNSGSFGNNNHPAPEPASTVSSVKSKARDLPEPDVRVHLKATAKTETLHSRLSSVDSTHLPSASSRPSLPGVPQPKKAQEEPRFTVTIHGPYADQVAEFKTRGKHSIRKVLASVCKTFEVDPERSRLLLVVEEGDEQIAYHCNPDETMEMCGVLPDSRLVLEVEGEHIDDEGEEEEED